MNPRFVMGTVLRARAEGTDGVAAEQEFLRIIQDLEDALSFYRADSDIARVNRAAGRKPVAVAETTLQAVASALEGAERTGGAFDPAFRSADGGCWQNVRLDRSAKTIFLETPAMAIDLGGMGKGFALDAALLHIRNRYSFSRLIADFGGQWLFWNESTTKETILIENPHREGRVLSTAHVQGNCSVSTSSQGQHPNHLIEPQTKTAANGYLSVTAIAPTATEAEILSTALFIAGPERAAGILPRFPGARAVLH